MKLYTNCKSCKRPITYFTWYRDRVTLARKKGEDILLQCRYCAITKPNNVDELEARTNKMVRIIAIVILVTGSLAMFLFLWNTLVESDYIIISIALFMAPSVTYLLLLKADEKRVSSFNRHKLKH